MNLTLDQLKAMAPRGAKVAADFLPHLNAAMQRFKITHLLDRQMFLATVLQESGELTQLQENMNYSAEALKRVWPKRFDDVLANKLARKPEAIANHVYAFRGGNGSEASGEGWLYRGAGLIQLTFKANQLGCAKYFGKKIEDMPAWLRTPEGASMSAAWYWHTRGISDYAIVDDFDGCCDMVNIGKKTAGYGDAEGFMTRISMLNRVKKIVKE